MFFYYLVSVILSLCQPLPIYTTPLRHWEDDIAHIYSCRLAVVLPLYSYKVWRVETLFIGVPSRQSQNTQYLASLTVIDGVVIGSLTLVHFWCVSILLSHSYWPHNYFCVGGHTRNVADIRSFLHYVYCNRYSYTFTPGLYFCNMCVIFTLRVRYGLLYLSKYNNAN